MSEREEIERLLAQVAMGDRGSFDMLYARSSAKLFGIALRVLKDRGEAEDVLQEVYLRIWDKAGQYRVNGLSPMTWLITVARNAAIDRLRRRKVRATEAVEGLEDRLRDPAPGPEAAAVAGAEMRRLSACFDELDPDRATAVRRAYLDGDTYAELATHFDVPLNTMRTWLRRSLLKLKECLAK